MGYRSLRPRRDAVLLEFPAPLNRRRLNKPQVTRFDPDAGALRSGSCRQMGADWQTQPGLGREGIAHRHNITLDDKQLRTADITHINLRTG
jgi:hypothetical protein